jgi:lactoylglutathione lyase
MAKPVLNLIVLRAINLADTLKFYQSLGLEFVEEKHGAEPTHYSSELNGVVIEIYPDKGSAPSDQKSASGIFLGFQINSIERTLETLKKLEIVITTPLQKTEWGFRAVVRDPDGRAVELTQRV